MSSVVGLEMPNAWRTSKPNNNVDFDISADQLNITANRQMFVPGSTVTWPSTTLHKNLTDPVDAQDAATRAFVLAQVSGIDELSELTDVTITSRTANQVLVVNAGNTFWVNQFLTNLNFASGVFSAIEGIGVQTQNLDLDTFGIVTATGALGALLKHDGTRYDDFLIGADNTILAVAGLDLAYEKIVNDLLTPGVFTAIQGLGVQTQILDMGTFKISNVVDPTLPQDVATKNFVDVNFAKFTDNLSVFASTTSAQLASVISDETGIGALVFNNGPTFITPALGTPASGILTNVTGLPILTGLAVGSSADLASRISDETGTGLLVFNDTPILLTPTIASFLNANHDHTVGAGGGRLTTTALVPGVFGSIEGLGVQSQALDMGSNLVSSVADPVSAQDAVTLAFLNAQSFRQLYTTKRQISIYHSFNTNIESILAGSGVLTQEFLSLVSVLDNDGYYVTYGSVAMTDNDAGVFVTGTSRRSANFDVTFKFRLSETTDRRCWIGFFSADPMADDVPVFNHFALRVSSSATNTEFRISHADGVTQADEVSLGAADTALHTIRLVADESGSRFLYSFDGATLVPVTTNIPGANDTMGIFDEVRTLANVTKSLSIWWADGFADQ